MNKKLFTIIPYNIKKRNFLLLATMLCLVFANSYSTNNNIALSYYIRVVNDVKASSADRLASADSIISMTKDEAILVKLRQIKADLYYKECRWNEALKEYSELLEDKTKLNLKDIYENYRQIALTNLKLGNYKESLNNAYTLIRYDKPDTLRYYTLLGEILLLNVYTRTSDLRNVRDLVTRLEKEVPQVKADKTSWRFIQSYWNLWLAHYYTTQDMWDEAFEAIQKSSSYDDTPGGNPKIAINTALIYDGIGKKDIEINIYKQLLNKSLNNENKCIVINNLAEYYLSMGEYDEVLNLIDNYSTDIDRLEMYHLKKQLFNIKSHAYEELGRFEEAFYAGEEARKCAEKMSAGYSQDLFDTINQYEREQKEKIEMQLKAERNQKFLVAIMLILLLILILIGVAYVKRYIRCRHNDVRELESKIEVISNESEKKLAETHKEMNAVNTEMSEMAIRMAHISHVIEEISSIANSSGKDSSGRLKQIRQLLKDIDIQKNIWDMVQICFERSDYDFFKNLYARHPDLTKGEVRMCVYILKNMTTKEISVITSRSSRTIDAIKYNLRKKLGITEPTLSYLRRLAGDNPENEC